MLDSGQYHHIIPSPDTPWDCHICRHWGGFGGQCRHIWHTWSVWDIWQRGMGEWSWHQRRGWGSRLKPEMGRRVFTCPSGRSDSHPSTFNQSQQLFLLHSPPAATENEVTRGGLQRDRHTIPKSKLSDKFWQSSLLV